MNENAEAESVFTEEDAGAFDAGWDDDPVAAYEVNDSEAEPETEPAGQETGSGEDQPAAEPTAEQETATQEPTPPESFELKYMGETLKVGREEMIALAQKGKDYDRIRTERDGMNTELESLRADKGKLTGYEDFLGKLALSVGMSIPDMMDSTLAKMLVSEEAKKGNTITEDFALQKIRFDREKAAFEQQKTQAGKKEPETKPEAEPTPPKQDDAAQARINDEISAFLAKYPGIDPKTIPAEVMEAWKGGTPLLYAYMEHENKTLKADNAAIEQNRKNSERSTGSVSSAGAGRRKDAFDMGWDSV